MARKSRKRTKNGAANGGPHPTDDGMRQALFVQHYRKIAALEANVKVAKKALADQYALAKSDKFPKVEFTIAFDLESEHGEEKRRIERERVDRIARWFGVPLGTQSELFGTEQVDRVFAAGKRAAFNDERRKPPGEVGINEQDRWFAGYDEGRVELNEVRAGRFKPMEPDGEFTPLGEAATDVVDSLAA